MLENADHSDIGLCTVRETVLARMVQTCGPVTVARAGKAAEGSLARVLPHPAPGTHHHGAQQLRHQARTALPQEQDALSQGRRQEPAPFLGDPRAVLQKRDESEGSRGFREESDAE